MVDSIAYPITLVARSNILNRKISIFELENLFSRLEDAVFDLKKFHFLFSLHTVGIAAILPRDLSHFFHVFRSIEPL